MRRSVQKFIVLLAAATLLFTGCAAIYEMNAISNDSESILSKGEELYLKFEADKISQYRLAQKGGESASMLEKEVDLFVLFSIYHKGNLIGRLSNNELQEHFSDHFDFILDDTQINELQKDDKTHSWGYGNNLTARWVGRECVSFEFNLNDGNGFEYHVSTTQYVKKGGSGWYHLSEYSAVWCTEA